MLRGPSRWVRSRLTDAIVAYRRHVSGRGPLRAVRCSFAATESCSAYGLRIATTPGRSLRETVARIRGRLRRCHDSCVYVTGEGALRWGADFDDLATVDARARAAEELPRTRGALLRAAIAVARHRGGPALQRLHAQLRRLHLPREATERLPLRNGDAYVRARGVGVMTRLALGFALALALAWASWSVAAALATAVLVWATLAWRRAGLRFARQARLAAFEVPHAGRRLLGADLGRYNAV